MAKNIIGLSRLVVEMPRDLKLKFDLLSRESGSTMSDEIRGFVAKYVKRPKERKPSKHGREKV